MKLERGNRRYLGAWLMMQIAMTVVASAATPKFLGNIWKGTDGTYATYWTQMTPENQGKWGYVEGTRDVMDWTAVDAMFSYCQSQGFPVKHHTFVWGATEGGWPHPAWITSLSPAEQAAEVEEWIAAYAARYPNTAFIDVVNEPLHHWPPFAAAIGGAGITGWDWMIWSFAKARQYCPNAQLLINDFSVLADYGTTANYLGLINLLKARGLIDGIGVQGHWLEGVQPYIIQDNLNTLATAGLPIYLTEFGLAFANDTEQLNNYAWVFPAIWTHPAVHGVTHWGYKQNTMWRPNAYLLRANGTERPALSWLTNYVATTPQYWDTTAPAAPTNLSANAISDARIDLTWSERAHNETEVLIERKLGAGGIYAQIAALGTNSQSYSDQTVSPGSSYYYRARARNAAGASGYSNEDDAATSAGGSTTTTTTSTSTTSATSTPTTSSTTTTAGDIPSAGLVLWLAADDVDGDGVSEGIGEAGLTGTRVDTWVDKAGGNHNATRQHGAPTLVPDAQHGLAVVRFSTSANPGDYFSFPGLTDIRSVFWIVRESSTASSRFLLGHSNDNTYHFHRGGANGAGWNLWNSTYAHPNVLNGTTRTNGVVVNGVSTALPEDAYVLVSLVTAGGVWADRITQDRQYNGSWEGDIAEILIYNTALNDADRAAVEAYLVAKWLAPATPTAGGIPSPGMLLWISADGVSESNGAPTSVTNAQ